MTLKLLLTMFIFCVTIVSSVITWKTSFQTALDDLNIEAHRKLDQAVDQFKGQISTARFLPTFIARSSEIVGGLEAGHVSDRGIEYLERARDLSGAHEIRLFDSNGYQLFSTSGQSENSNRRDSDYFFRAMHGALGVEVRPDESNIVRTLVFARSIIGKGRKQIGAVVLDVEIELLESEFRARPDTILFLDESNTVVFSNRSKLLFKNISPSINHVASSDTVNIMISDTNMELSVKESKHGAVTLWNEFPQVPYVASNLVAQQLILPMGLNAIILVDSSPALIYARKMTYLMVALLILGFVTGFALLQRRRYFIDRIAAKQSSISDLDKRVALRSKELEQAQNELVQSAKLSALGKMSIGISHELNQPISSIQNFSVNAIRFIKNNRTTETIENLNEVVRQTERMSRIIRNLADFSRKDNIASGPVDICEVWTEVSSMMTQRLHQENVVITCDVIEQPLMVVGGEVRLQQVLINIISNAIEAMKTQPIKQIRVKIMKSENLAMITIQDNGPGLSEPTRVFEPFYTTKTGSHEDGLGLGLSIAYGFVDSFGGSLIATNSKSGGALFTLKLPVAS